MKSTTCLAVMLSLLITVHWGFPVHATDDPGPERLQVVATLFPLFDWARIIGGERADVNLLLPPGVEAHAFEPTPRDIVAINKADLFIYTGESMEPWVRNLLGSLTNRSLMIVDSSEGIDYMEEARHEGAGAEGQGRHDSIHDHEKEAARRHDPDHQHSRHHDKIEGHHHDRHGGKDPHIWLEFGNAQKMVNHIARAFSEKDPASADLYLSRAAEYNNQLIQLEKAYEQTLAGCRHKTLVYGGHFAFGYLAARYGLKHISPYQGFTPDAEPTPKRIAELIDYMKQSGMKAIFFEEGIEPRVAKVLGRETGAQLLLLHGAHNVTKEEMARNVSYLSIMEENLERLTRGLECS